MQRLHTDTVMLFGDCRAYHRGEIEIAQARKIELCVIEKRYLTGIVSQDFEIMRNILSLVSVALPTDDVGPHRMPGEMDARLTDKARENPMRWYEKVLEIYACCRRLHQQFIDKLNEGRDFGSKMRTWPGQAA
jgi:hypothetical protein